MSASLIALLTAALVLDTAHTVAPIVMAWAHPGFRRVMLGQQVKFLIVPSAVLAATMAIGLATSAGLTGYDLRHPHQMQRITGLDNPFPLIVWLYWAWNIYHFGAQNFGLARLIRVWAGRPGPRWLDRMVCVGGTAAGMVLLPFWVGWAMFSVTHWLTELSLTAYVSSRRVLFLAIVLPFGILAFLWTLPPWRSADLSHGNMIAALPWLISLRLGLGFVHFLYDRRVWKFSDPAVRATIGRDLVQA